MCLHVCVYVQMCECVYARAAALLDALSHSQVENRPSLLLFARNTIRMDLFPVQYTPSVLTSEVYNEAEVVFTMLQNKEKLISFLDCTTVLRAMGMNPTNEDTDRLKLRMAEPVFLLEQWRREEELKREKERRKEEAREQRGAVRGKPSAKRAGGKPGAPRKSFAEQVAAEEAEGKPPAKAVPVEEIKNIDWNIFINCAEEMYRDTATEQHEVLNALTTFNVGGPSLPHAAADDGDAADDVDALMAAANDDGSGGAWVATPGKMTVDELIRILTTNGDNVLTPAEVKQLRAVLPSDDAAMDFTELSARLQGTYKPPTKEELDRIAAAELEAIRQREEAEKEVVDDPLAGL